MSSRITRRDAVRAGAVIAGSTTLGIPEWVLLGLGQEHGSTLVPFTDITDDFITDPPGPARFLDIRTIVDFYTPADKFFTIQHYGQPEIDRSSYRLQISGMVSRPQRFSLADLRGRRPVELACAFECSGNSSRRFHGLVSNGHWRGVSLRSLLEEVGLQEGSREVVFFGVDRGEETITSRGRSWDVEQQFARSVSIEDAMGKDTLLAYELNGEPLSIHQGAPLRLIVPGWYGVAQVKWLSQIHLQDARFMGKFMAREYVTLAANMVGDEVKYTETSITRIRLKSVIARVTRGRDNHTIHGFALTDGTPLKAVEVQVDDGLWMPATMDARNTKYSWQLFSYCWEGATPGEHSITSRAIDVNDDVQPVQDDLVDKKTGWENNAQFTRRVMIS